MKWVRVLVAGAPLLLGHLGCSNSNKVTNVVGSYAPVIVDIALNQPPALSPSIPLGYVPAVRDSFNQFAAIITNPGGISLKYHWSVAAGVLLDSTTAAVRWHSPNQIGTVDITVAVEGDDANDVHYYRTRTFHIYTDNAYLRWTRGPGVQFDPAPRLAVGTVTQGPLLYSEFTNVAAGKTGVFSVQSPEGPATLLTPTFFQASSPTLRPDESEFAFQGKRRDSDLAYSIYLLPSAGGDTTQARVASQQNNLTNKILASPRFARTGTTLLYQSDSTSGNNPKPWVRDASNLSLAPARLIPIGQAPPYTWWNSNWNGAGDSVVAEGYRNFSSIPIPRGLFKIWAVFPYQDASSGLENWLADSAAFEPDWSPDGAHIVFTRFNQAGDRDIWIIRADTNDKTQAVRVTSGPADDAHPRFSSDGSAIFFASNRADAYGYNGLFGLERRGTNIWAVSRFDRP